jgi:hypothetical protein
MTLLFYGTDQFEVPEFHRRRVMDEIEMTMSAFDCILPDDAGIYCSSDITTGKRYYRLLKKHQVTSEAKLEKKIGPKEFKQVKTRFIRANVVRGSAFAEKIRERGLTNVVTPGPYFARGFDQQHYLYFWEWFIIKKIYEVRFNYEWEYSMGCTVEYAIACRKDIPRLDHEGSPLSLADAINKVEAAVKKLKAQSFTVEKLEENLRRLKSIKK